MYPVAHAFSPVHASDGTQGTMQDVRPGRAIAGGQADSMVPLRLKYPTIGTGSANGVIGLSWRSM